MSDTVKSWIEERRTIHTGGRDVLLRSGYELERESGIEEGADIDAIVDAHNSLPRALDALNAVLRRHAPHVPGVIDICAECDMSWPCATVTVIESALEAGE